MVNFQGNTTVPTIPENPLSPRISNNSNGYSTLHRNNSVTSFTSFTSLTSNNTTISTATAATGSTSKALLKKQLLTRDLERNIRKSLLDTPTNLPVASEHPQEEQVSLELRANSITKLGPAATNHLNRRRQGGGISDSDDHLAMKSSSSKSSSTKTLSTPTTSISEDIPDSEDSKPPPTIHIPINVDTEDTVQSSRETTGMMSHPGTDLSSISEEEKSLPLCESTKIHDNDEMNRHLSLKKSSTTLEVANPSLQRENKVTQRSSSSSTSSDNFLRDSEVDSPSTSCSNASVDANLQGSTTLHISSRVNNSRGGAMGTLMEPSPPQTTFNLDSIVNSLPTRLKSLSGDSMNRTSSIRLLISHRQRRPKSDSLSEDQAFGSYKDLTNMEISNSDVPERRRPLTSWKGDRSALSSIINRHSKYMKFVNDAGCHESDEDSSATSSPKSRLDFILDQLELMDDSEIAELYKTGELDWLHEHGIDPESIIPRPILVAQDSSYEDDPPKLSSTSQTADHTGTAAFIARAGPVLRQYAPAPPSSSISLTYHTADPSPLTEKFEDKDDSNKNYTDSPIRDPNSFPNPSLLRTPNNYSQESPSTLTPSTLIALEEAPMLNMKQSDAPESRKTSPLRTRNILAIQREASAERKPHEVIAKEATTKSSLETEGIEAETIKPLYLKYRNRSDGSGSKSASEKPECAPSKQSTTFNSQDIVLAELFKGEQETSKALKEFDFDDDEEIDEFVEEDVLHDSSLDLRPSSLTLPPSPFNGPSLPEFNLVKKKSIKSVLTSDLTAPNRFFVEGKLALKNSSLTSLDRVQNERSLSKDLALMENSTPIRQLLNDDSLSIDGALLPPPTPPPKDSPTYKELARKVKKQRRRQQKEAERKKQKEQEALDKLENRVASSKGSSTQKVTLKAPEDRKVKRKQSHNNFLSEFEKPRPSNDEAINNHSPLPITPKKSKQVASSSEKAVEKSLSKEKDIQPQSHKTVDVPSQQRVASVDNGKNAVDDISQPAKSSNSANIDVMKNSKSEISDISLLSKESFTDAQAEQQHGIQSAPRCSLPPVVKPFSVNPYNLPNNSDTRVAGFDYGTPYKNAALARAKRLEVETLPDPTIDMKCEVVSSALPKEPPKDELVASIPNEVVSQTSKIISPTSDQPNAVSLAVTIPKKDFTKQDVTKSEVKVETPPTDDDVVPSTPMKLSDFKTSPVSSMIDAVTPTESPQIPLRRRAPGLTPLLATSESFMNRPPPPETERKVAIPSTTQEPQTSSANVTKPPNANSADVKIATTSTTGRKPPPPISTESSAARIEVKHAPTTQKQGFLEKKPSKGSFTSSDPPEKPKKTFKNVFTKIFKKSGSKSNMFEVVEPPPRHSHKQHKEEVDNEAENEQAEEETEEEKSLTTQNLSLSLPPLELESPSLFDDMFTTFDEIDKRKSFLTGGVKPPSIVPTRSGLTRQPFFFRDDELSTDQIMDQQLKDDKDNGISSEASKNNSEEDLFHGKHSANANGGDFLGKDILGSLSSLRKPVSTNSKGAPTDSVYIDDNILFLQNEFNWKNLSLEGETTTTTSSRLHPMEQQPPRSPLTETLEIHDVSQFDDGNSYLKLAKQFKVEITKGEPLEVIVNKFEDDVTYRPVPPSEVRDGLKPILSKRSKIGVSPNPALMNRSHSYNINLDYRQKPTPISNNNNNINKSVQFDRKILINETFAPDQYRRYNKCVTQYTLTDPNEINKIKDELNTYKCNEMLIHNHSKKYTHFFY
ncbi:uncharacterized protein KQ657_003443 [Scheffersomyces spartinae]|uniref:Uncharacterized protein n=1 Tax=Scheffersomyces spartinae TaxID=45513 RepID=A0A9P7V5A7_9ASCO|nr:uncharacterized protein KQ657_003443 [Scheffersomyces spartinae]KAG7191399.1 hypothetical protein KQ657_003443 [Scheffersomyces spartinae]